jgi:hypothetical protein
MRAQHHPIWPYPFNLCYGHNNPNAYDLCLVNEARMWAVIQAGGGITHFCRRGTEPRYEVYPWVVMPPQGRRFQYINTIPRPPVGVETEVLKFRVALGWNGVIRGVVNNFIGAGFKEGSGDLVWRIQLNLRYARDYGNIKTSLGDLTGPYDMNAGGILIKSGEDVRYLVTMNAAGAAHLDPAGRVLASLYGWTYPRPGVDG